MFNTSNKMKYFMPSILVNVMTVVYREYKCSVYSPTKLDYYIKPTKTFFLKHKCHTLANYVHFYALIGPPFA